MQRRCRAQTGPEDRQAHAVDCLLADHRLYPGGLLPHHADRRVAGVGSGPRGKPSGSSSTPLPPMAWPAHARASVNTCARTPLPKRDVHADTLIISYDTKRGEPRRTRKKGVDPASVGKGSCVDCGICVQVCPTGINMQRPAIRVPSAAALPAARRLRRGDGQDELPARPDPLHHGKRAGKTLSGKLGCWTRIRTVPR